ncbi:MULTISPECIES: tyrosine-type recombinase/integrase [Rhodomicrobium]|uniref:tyrosine-type recombinase/integrase n=1 Tax=Rhodomicrobium TaxID=1068 RepID=UPI000B4AAC09|nr:MULTISPECIES: tyrosine-type recombinase/integrase [Rhodomicrobium]
MPATVTRVQGIKRYFEPKAGKYYCYHRATGRRMKEEFGSPEFFSRLAELDKVAKDRAELDAKPGTLKELILNYKLTDEFKDLTTRTRSDYEKVFDFLGPLWKANLSAFTPPTLNALRIQWRQERGRRFVNYIRSVLSILFVHAMSMGTMSANPARDMKKIKRPRDARTVNRPWTMAERKVVLENLAPHLRLPVAIALYTGIRQGDVLTLPRKVVAGNCINITTSKRLVAIDIHVLADLRQALREAPTHDAITLCANSRGRPWTESGFRASFRKELKKLEAKKLIGAGLTFHGLRHTVATVLAEAGVTAEDIAAVLGQRSSKMAEHYSREADRSHRSKAAIRKLKPLERGGRKGRTGTK